ncbi:hypothetical protein [Rhodococcoides trifolii]|nr:hypothetical protein [Rhodococcus trifolii]
MSDKTASEDPGTESTEPKGGRPGPADHNGSGGMASRELAADEEAESDD